MLSWLTRYLSNLSKLPTKQELENFICTLFPLPLFLSASPCSIFTKHEIPQLPR